MPIQQSPFGQLNLGYLVGTVVSVNAGAPDAGTLRVAIAATGGVIGGVNVAQIAGTATSVNAGAADAGTIRVAVASGITIPTNLTQVGGVAVTVGSGASGTGTQRVILATDQPTIPVDTELPAAAALGDSVANPTTSQIGAAQELWNPANATWERQRTPTVFKAVNGVTATGSTAVWTPAAGKRFRLMGFTITVSGNAARAAGSSTIIGLLDVAAVIFQVNPFVPAAAATTMGADFVVTVLFPGNGYLSTAINQTLNVNLGGALTVGQVAVSAFGTEE